MANEDAIVTSECLSWETGTTYSKNEQKTVVPVSNNNSIKRNALKNYGFTLLKRKLKIQKNR